MLFFVPILMTLKLRCDEYGFECDFSLEGEKSLELLEGEKSLELLEKLRVHFEEEHGIEYPIDAVIQMIVNRGHSLNSIKK
jgi:predicted small metal-binding protein